MLDRHISYPIETEIASLTILPKKSIAREIWISRLFEKSTDQIINTFDQLENIFCFVVSISGEFFYSDSYKLYIAKTD